MIGGSPVPGPEAFRTRPAASECLLGSPPPDPPAPSKNRPFDRALARAPQLRLLHRLVLRENLYEQAGEYEPSDDIPEGTDYPQLYPLVRCPYLTNVRQLVLGETWTLPE